jgi:hypothetical protein
VDVCAELMNKASVDPLLLRMDLCATGWTGPAGRSVV